MAHRIELRVLQVTRQDEQLRVLQDVMKKNHKHYQFTPTAQRELKDIAEALEEKSLKPSCFQESRWLPHISGVLNVIPEKYPILYAHFDHVSQSNSGNAEVSGQ